MYTTIQLLTLMRQGRGRKMSKTSRITLRIGAANNKFQNETGLVPDRVYLGTSEYLELKSVLSLTKNIVNYCGMEIVEVFERSHLCVTKCIGE